MGGRATKAAYSYSAARLYKHTRDEKDDDRSDESDREERDQRGFGYTNRLGR
eukprot:GDKH01025493.1.p2 GENE.GDKH01025493.1~~GDKH01025493.1.p2  ORF type:complete len:52 (+),score=17.94 GDKH01025493.1:1-156(+)